MGKRTSYKIILLILLLLGFIDYQFINPQRIIFTAEILGLPPFMNYPILILEHVLGFMALGFLILIILQRFNKKIEKKLNKLNWNWFVIMFILIAVSVYYEIWDQKCKSYWQIIFDFIGIIIFYKYTKYAFSL